MPFYSQILTHLSITRDTKLNKLSWAHTRAQCETTRDASFDLTSNDNIFECGAMVVFGEMVDGRRLSLYLLIHIFSLVPNPLNEFSLFFLATVARLCCRICNIEHCQWRRPEPLSNAMSTQVVFSFTIDNSLNQSMEID